MIKLFAFDRDQTVDVNEGPVPLSYIVNLKNATNHEIWAIGNQFLVNEAGIPGLKELRSRYGVKPKITPPDKCWPQGLTQDEKNVWAKIVRLDMLKSIFPEIEHRIVIDDFDLSHALGWKYYTPEQFVLEFVNNN